MQTFKKHPQLLSFLLLAILTTAVYWPALFHAARADHIIYLAETAQRTTWWQTAVETFDLNRTSLYSPGDEKLFRPLFYFIIGNERFFFGYNFFYWQLCGLLAHLIVVWRLFCLLNKIHPGFSAWLVSAFFSFMSTNVEMVTWHHITGYLVFTSLLLAACEIIFSLLVLKKTTPQNFSALWLYLCLASFIFELGIAAVLLSALAFRIYPDKNTRKFVTALLAIPAAYVLLNTLSLLARKISADTLIEGALGAIKPLWQTLGAPLAFGGWWLISGLFPSAFHLRIGPRTVVAKENPLTLWNNPSDWSLWCALILCILTLSLLFKSFNRTILKERFSFLLVLLGIPLVFSCQAAMRSITTDTWDALRINLYYTYLFWIFFIPAAFSMFDFSKLTQYPWFAVIRITVLCLLFLLTGHNALQTFYINLLRAHKDAPVLALNAKIQTLIRNKSNEADFSFFVADDFPGNHLRENIPLRGTRLTVTKNAAELLYPQHVKRENPKYLLSSPGTEARP